MTAMFQAQKTVTGDELHFSTFGRDPDLGELVEMFVEEMPGRICHLMTCLEGNDWTELARSAHQIKGSAGSYGFDIVTPVAAKLEHACNHSPSEEQILDSCNELISILRSLRAGSRTRT